MAFLVASLVPFCSVDVARSSRDRGAHLLPGDVSPRPVGTVEVATGGGAPEGDGVGGDVVS